MSSASGKHRAVDDVTEALVAIYRLARRRGASRRAEGVTTPAATGPQCDPARGELTEVLEKASEWTGAEMMR